MRKASLTMTMRGLDLNNLPPGLETWLSIADELTDGSPHDLCFPDDFDKRALKLGEAAAKEWSLPWPPRVGDLDRALEIIHGTRNHNDWS